MSYTYEDITFEKKGGVAIATLNRPDQLNAMSAKMMEGLATAIEEVRRDDKINVFVLTGQGRGFCAGADASALASISSEGFKPEAIEVRLRPMGAAVLQIANLEKPTIAAVNGVAVGGGLGMALACDIRIASHQARFSAIFVRRGLVPDFGSGYFLPRLVGVSKACELIYTGAMVDAQEAERIGLVSRVVPHENLMGATMELASAIAKGPPIALRLMKRNLYSSLSTDLETYLHLEDSAQKICFSTEDFKEGIQSFLEKREPMFAGR